MKTKRLAAGHYEVTGTTILDGVQQPVRFNIWKHEEIKGCWLIETEINGRSTGCFGDYCFKDEAVRAAKRCAANGYATVPGLGICLANGKAETVNS
jgi:hypothetical protein